MIGFLWFLTEGDFVIRFRTGLFSLLACALFANGEAGAQALGPGIHGDGWHYSLTAYSFLPVSSTGEATVAGAAADVDLNLRDVFKTLNFAAAARGEAWNGDFGAILDLYYVNIGGDVTVAPGGPLDAAARADISLRQGWVALMGAWRFAQGTYGDAGLRYSFDLGAGARLNLIDQDVKLRAGVAGRGVQRNFGGQETWVEPTVSLRGMVELSPEVLFGARFEAGGFGVGGDDLQWLALAGVEYRPWQQTSLRIGWQAYSIDYSANRSDGLFAYDVFQTGPYIGLTYRF